MPHPTHHQPTRARTPTPAHNIPTTRPAGSAETLKISITHVRKYDLWLLGVWPVQKRKGLRCVSRTIYERTVAKLSRLLQQSKAGGGGEGDSAPRFEGADLPQLTILSAPYQPPGPEARALVVRQGPRPAG